MYTQVETRSASATFCLFVKLALFALLSACGSNNDEDTDDKLSSISIADVSIVEGNSGNQDMVFTVTASPPSPTDIVLDYATSDDTAVSPTDYLETSGSLTIPAGATRADIVIQVIGDTELEVDETFELTLSNATAAALIGTSTAVGTISNDDTMAPTLSISDASVVEGNSGTTVMSFSVSLDAVAAADVTVEYATSDGSAVAPDDFAASSGTLTIAAGDMAAGIEISVVADTAYEADESFSLTLSNVSPTATLGKAAASGLIVNDDSTVAPGMSLNDTGQALCTTEFDYDLPCNDSGFGTDQFPGQDAQSGRDASNNDDSDGRAGFSFTKLDASGVPLLDQQANYAQEPWACVRDEVTGLTWEVKTDSTSAGRHAASHVFTWYDSSGIAGGDSTGIGSGGECFDADRCDTQKFSEDVSSEGLCGFSDWRLPTRTELLSIMDYGADYQPLMAGWKTAFIDKAYFPNTHLEQNYWTSSAGSLGGRHVIAFDGSPSRSEPLYLALSARLVRGGN